MLRGLVRWALVPVVATLAALTAGAPGASAAADLSTVAEALRESPDYVDPAASDLPARGTAAIEVIDPVNPDNNVAVRYDAVEKKRIIEAAQDAFDALSEARYATTKTRAVDAWQVVLGPSFRA